MTAITALIECLSLLVFRVKIRGKSVAQSAKNLAFFALNLMRVLKWSDGTREEK
jgi:hypothetical protein